jgi:hypothetical protein
MLASVDLVASTNAVAGFGPHPDGKLFLRSMARWPYDIWVLEGFAPPRQKTWMEGLLGRRGSFAARSGVGPP